MSYADGLMSKGEVILHREKQHWWVFIWSAKWVVLAIILALFAGLWTSGVEGDGFLADVAGFIAFPLVPIIFIGGLLYLGWVVLQYLNQEYVLTNRRVIQVSGVLSKKAADSSLEKINDATLEQSVFGRMFGFGDLAILTAADTGIDRFKMLIRPIEFKKAMLDAKYAYEHGADNVSAPVPVNPPLRSDAPPAAAASAPVGDETMTTAVPQAAPAVAAADAMDPDEVTRTLASLADLRDRGAITAEEYDRKKSDLLSRL